MNYKINVYVSKENEGNVRGFANVVFGNAFKVTNIVILQKKDSDELFVSMPRYRSNEIDENGNPVYKDIMNPVTAEFRENLYGNIIKTFEAAAEKGKAEMSVGNQEEGEIAFKVSVSPYERDGSSIRAFGRIYIEDCFVVGNISVLQGKERLFVAMPSYKTKQIDDNGKPVYQDIAYPVTKDFREKLYGEILGAYDQSKKKDETISENIPEEFEKKQIEEVKKDEKKSTPKKKSGGRKK